MQKNKLLIPILTLGVFGIINTEMGVIGIIPLIAETFNVNVPQAGWTVSAFALVVAVSAPILPLLFSGINRKTTMMGALALFVLSNIIAMLTDDFNILVLSRIIPGFAHPVYVSMAFAVAAQSVSAKDAPKAVAKVFIGVSAGMVLGVPVTTFIADHTSFSIAMGSFALVNVIVLLATLFFIPSMPVTEKLTYGSQLNVLRKPVLWLGIFSSMLMNAAVFGFFSYMSDFLKNITALSFDRIGIVLFVYGAANILGNMIAGRALSARPALTLKTLPLILAPAYLSLYVFGEQPVMASLIIGLLGILAGVSANGTQYLVTHAAPEAPDFANGLFLAAVNLGTTVGTAICGAVIGFSATQYSLFGALALLAVAFVFIVLRMKAVKA